MDLLIPPRQGESNRNYAWRVIRLNIMMQRLAPGEPLNEQDLSNVLEMSRTPIHEAITHLQSEWLVDVYPQRGTSVSLIDPQLVKEGYEARLLLETALLKDNAGKFGRSDIQQLMECMHRQEATMEAHPNAVDQYILLDDDFHRLMYKFGGRLNTWTATRGLIAHYDRMRYLDALDGVIEMDRVKRQHREYCDYLLMGLPEDVDPEEHIRAHLTSFRGNLMDKIAMHPTYFTIS